MRFRRTPGFIVLICGLSVTHVHAQNVVQNVCPRPAVRAEISEPFDLRSQNGELSVALAFRKSVDARGAARYCYVDQYGHESPNLRVHPGDLLTIRLKNDLDHSSDTTASPTGVMDMTPRGAETQTICAGAAMTATSTNLHFHGMSIPPVCHEDDVIRTSIGPGDPPFEYRVRIPANQPPGLYWYHPHLHGFSKAQVLGGASGALIVEGIEKVNQAAASLPERDYRDSRPGLTESGCRPGEGRQLRSRDRDSRQRRRKRDQYRRRQRQAGQGPFAQFCSSSLPELPSGFEFKDQAGRAAGVAEC